MVVCLCKTCGIFRYLVRPPTPTRVGREKRIKEKEKKSKL